MHPTPVPPSTDPTSAQLLDERIVLIGGEIDDDTAHRVVAQLLLLAARDARRDVTLYVHSAGGAAVATLAIHDTMRLIAPDVTTVAVGLVAGAGLLLVTAGAPGRRTVLPHARLRIGAPVTDHRDPGIRDALRREAAAITARGSGRTPEQLAADADRWFTAPEAVAYGLVDAVSSAPDG